MKFDARIPQKEGKLLISVLHHETAASMEPANLIISQKLEELLCRYLNSTLP